MVPGTKIRRLYGPGRLGGLDSYIYVYGAETAENLSRVCIGKYDLTYHGIGLDAMGKYHS